MNKLIRITTIPLSLDKLLEGQLNYMSDKYDVIAVSSNDNGYLHQVAEREKVGYYPIELTRAITPIADLRALWNMVGLLKKEKPLIVHTHTPKAGTIGMIAAKLAGVPIRLHTVAGLPLLETQGPKRKLLNAVEKITYAAATKVLPNSFGLKQIILNEGFCKADKLEVIGQGSSNGIDTDYFDPERYTEKTKNDLRVQLNILPEDFVFIFVGRIVKDKGIIELVEAFKELKRDDVKLLLVGTFEHNLDPLPESTLTAIKNINSIIETGWQTDVRPYLAISDALAFPSYREGFPNVVMQAGAMGLPSIVSNINGCNEIIVENVNGNIIPVKEVTALYDAMQKFLMDPSYYAKLKSNSREMIVKNYQRSYIWNELQKLYEHEISNLT